jgi:hypothetical protein
VSDREIAKSKLGDVRWEEYTQQARKMIQEGNEDEIGPKKYWKWLGGGACSAYRFNSLVGPNVHPSTRMTEVRVMMIFSRPI